MKASRTVPDYPMRDNVLCNGACHLVRNCCNVWVRVCGAHDSADLLGREGADLRKGMNVVTINVARLSGCCWRCRSVAVAREPLQMLEHPEAVRRIVQASEVRGFLK